MSSIPSANPMEISSTTPVTALISVRSPITSFALLQLDGTVDWMLAQRKALLAWTGHSMRSIIHWGNTEVTGRGLVAITGNGQIYSVELKEGEQYIAHPSNVLAYTLTSLPPQPYRFKSTTLRFQVPSLGVGSWLSKSNFIKNMSGSDTWKAVRGIFYTLRIWTRKTIWGDRLFLQFNGPATILIQSRASRLNDSLTDQQVNEIADSPAGTVEAAVDAATPPLPTEEHSGLEHAKAEKVVRQSIANVRRDGKVEFKPPLNEQ
ncbi:Altered inheritance of mitochondria protein 24, mitochondrial [Myotisia sp. PD_48]|nr:Altered inheritance of mitochondria protein 24, mitochondrial [Myotisia sp. PD_48]